MPQQKDLRQAQQTSAPKVVAGRQLTLREFVHKKRTRVKRSCDLCRKRKIKCDSNIIRPCTSCRNSGVDCNFLYEARKPGPPSKEYLDTLEVRLKRLEAHLSSQQTHTDDRIAVGQNDSTRKYDIQPTSSQQNITTTPEIASSDRNKGYRGVSTSSAGLYMLYESLLQLNSAPGNLPWSIEQTLGDSRKSKHISARSTTLYPEKQQLIQSISGFTEDLADKMIQAYFESVHPFAPVLDKRTFLLQYYYQYPKPLDRYLLYAVCTAGSRVLPLENEVSGSPNMNWETIVSIRQELQKEALKIAQIAPYQSSITTLQTLLILAMLGVNAGEEAGRSVNWFLAGMTIRMAQDLELHLGSRQNHLQPGEIELRRRIAYVICILDRMVAAAYDKPFAIKDEEFDVVTPSIYETPLEDSDFVFKESSTVPLILQETEVAIRQHRPAYTSFLRMISLSQMFGQVLTSMYSTNRGKKSLSDTFFIQSLDMALANWKRELQSTQYSMTNTICKGGVLNIFYNCVVLLLYRPLVIGSNVNESNAETSQLLNCCNMISVNIVDMVEMSDNLGVKCMPWSLVDYAMGQASIIFLHISQSRNTDTRYQGYIHLLRCAKMYKNDDIMSKSRNAKILEQVAQQVTLTLGVPASLSGIASGQQRITLEDSEQKTGSSVQQPYMAIGTFPSSSGIYSTTQQEDSSISLQEQTEVNKLAGDIQVDEASVLQHSRPSTVGIPPGAIDQQPNIPMTNIPEVSQGLNVNASSNMTLLNYYLTALELADQPPPSEENERLYNE